MCRRLRRTFAEVELEVRCGGLVGVGGVCIAFDELVDAMSVAKDVFQSGSFQRSVEIR